MKSSTDILSMFAHLSYHEVFTPPEIAKKMLKMLPSEIWTNPAIKLLDPCAKSGVFLREAFFLFNEGLMDYGLNDGKFQAKDGLVYDLKKPKDRANHILKNMLFGIATGEITAYVSRRTLYGVMEANSDKQTKSVEALEANPGFNKLSEEEQIARITEGVVYNEYFDHNIFTDVEGNVFYPVSELNSNIEILGLSEDKAVLFSDTFYPFIHDTSHKTIKAIKENNMKFDVIIGNPPYQLSVGNTEGNSSKAKSLYHHFVQAAIDLKPRYISMIVPSRWMTKSADGIPDEWVEKILNSNKIKEMHDFLDSNDCFPSVEVKGGVSYFLWEATYTGKCMYNLYTPKNEPEKELRYLNETGVGTVIRDIQGSMIFHKVVLKENTYFKLSEKNFSGLVSPKDFFTNKTILTSKWNGFQSEQAVDANILVFLNKGISTDVGYMSIKNVPKNKDSVPLHKVLISAAAGTGSDKQVLGKPFYACPNSVCSQTYLVIGYDPVKHNFTEAECLNIISYIKTKFFRFLVSLKKKTQNGPRMVYQLAPIQAWSEPWTDEKLYAKYELSPEEIAYIESKISKME